MTDQETFTLSDLTEEFFRKVCYVEHMKSSGLIGEGYIFMVTEDGWGYWLGIEGYDEAKPEDIVPLLAIHKAWDEEKHRRVYCIENNGWTCLLFFTNILIRNDIYEKMNKLHYESEHRNLEGRDLVGKERYELLQRVLKPKHGLQRKVYIKTKEKREKEELEHRKYEEKRKKIALTAKDIEWKPIHMNNLLCNPIEGFFGFLFKREKDGGIKGYKWTILFQYQEIRPGCREEDAPIEAYNLFFKVYRDVAGVLGYRKPGHTHWQCYAKSTIRDGIYRYGKFVRSYKTLELAKEAVLYGNEWIGNVNLENIIRVSMDEQSISEMEKDYEAKIEEKRKLNIEKDITFKELRNYLSLIDRLSICILETSCYEKFLCLEDVPHTYDGYYVYGIGMIESEFYKVAKCDYAASGKQEELVSLNCMEVMLSREPKSVLVKRDREELASSD